MRGSWQTEQGHLAWRWSGAEERTQYRAPWLQEASGRTPRMNLPALLPDFAQISPFGSHWYVLDRLREEKTN